LSNVLARTDIDAIDGVLAATYGRADYRGAIVVDGYGVRISVDRGHLTIADGIGAHRRTRILTRSQNTVKRIIIIGDSGTISLAAIRWCVDTDIAMVQVTSEGRVLAETVGHSPRESRLRRAQALASTNGVDVQVATHLIGKKIQGHARNLTNRLGNAAVANELLNLDAQLSDASGIAEIRDIESRAAALYFKSWQSSVRLVFATRDASRVPEHWRGGNPRTSRHWATSRSPRKATDPVNAMLNYAYALAEVECRIACVAVGLDPALGVVHTDIKHRQSLALDLLEAVRPSVELHVLDVLAVRRFRSVDFIETPDGTCRLTESVTHPLTAGMHDWARTVAPVAEHVAHVIGASSLNLVRARTPLTREQQRTVARAQNPSGVKRTNAPKSISVVPLPSCIDCGRPLTHRRRKRCGDCEALAKVDRMTARAANGRATRLSAAVDSAQTPEARAARIAGITASRVARDQWEASHTVTNEERAEFTETVIPGLSMIPLQTIAEAIGVSIASASLIRRRVMAPHARHWATLSLLVASRHDD
jgi:CRISPR-associated endonuclease Cas1